MERVGTSQVEVRKVKIIGEEGIKWECYKVTLIIQSMC